MVPRCKLRGRNQLRERTNIVSYKAKRAHLARQRAGRWVIGHFTQWQFHTCGHTSLSLILPPFNRIWTVFTRFRHILPIRTSKLFYYDYKYAVSVCVSIKHGNWFIRSLPFNYVMPDRNHNQLPADLFYTDSPPQLTSAFMHQQTSDTNVIIFRNYVDRDRDWMIP